MENTRFCRQWRQHVHYALRIMISPAAAAAGERRKWLGDSRGNDKRPAAAAAAETRLNTKHRACIGLTNRY